MSAAQPFPTIALVGRYASPGIAEPLSRLAAFLTGRGHRVLIDAETARLTPLPGYPTAPMAEPTRREICVSSAPLVTWLFTAERCRSPDRQRAICTATFPAKARQLPFVPQANGERRTRLHVDIE